MALDITSIALSKKIAQDVVETATVDVNGVIHQQITSTVDNAIKEFSETVSDDGLINTYHEIIEFIDVYKPQLDQAIEITSQHAADLKAEAETREAADEVLSQRISTEETDRKDADEALSQQISAETADRKSADIVLTEALEEEATAREQAITDLVASFTLQIETEASERQSVDAAIQAALEAETSARQAADTTLNAALEAETATRKAADEALSQQVSVEVTNREAADMALTNAIAAETTARTQAITDLTDSFTTQITTEASERQSVDTAIQTALDTEVSRAKAAEEGLKIDVFARIDALNTAQVTLSGSLVAETARATDAEALLQANIDSAVSAANRADDELRNSIAELAETDTETLAQIQKAISDFNSYIEADGSVAAGFRADIDKNKQDISNNSEAISANTVAINNNANEIIITKASIATEEARAVNAENALDSKIGAILDPSTGILATATAYTDTKVSEINESLDAHISDAEADSVAIRESILEVQEELASYKASNDTAVTTNKDNIAANKVDIAANTDQITLVATQLTAESTRAQAAEKALDDKITEINAPITGILDLAKAYTDTEVHELSLSITDQLRATNAEILENENNIKKNATDIAKNVADIEQNAADIEKNTVDIAEHATVIEKNTAAIAQNTGDIEKNAADITKNAADITKNVTDIEKNATDIVKIMSDIAKNTADIEQNTAGIAQNATYISENAADLQELSSAVDTNITAVANEISATKTQLNNVQQELTTHKNATESAVAANTAAITVLNSNNTVDGSVDFKIDAALNKFAGEISTDGTINTFKELVDYVAAHGSEFSELVGTVDANTGKIAINTDDITVLRSQLLQLDALCKSLQADLGRMQDVVISVTCNDTEILFAPGELTRYFAYNDSAIFTAKAADSVTDRVLAHLTATYTTGPNADKTLSLVNIGENTNFGGTQYKFSNITGKATLNGVWADSQWAPTWVGNGGTLQNGITDIRVVYGTGINAKDMPYATGTGTELGTNTVTKFNGWTVSGNEVTSTGVAAYSGRNYISPTALNATATATYTTVADVRNKASKLGETYTISTSNSNNAVQSRICPVGALASDSYIVGGVQSVNGRTGFGFTKAGKPISERYVWSGWMVPVVFDGEIAAGLKSGKFTASDLIIEVTADIHVGAGIGDESNGRSSAWFDVQPSFSNLGSAFTWAQSNATDGKITTNFTPFSGASVSAVTSAIGTAPAPVTVYSNGNTSYATTDSTQTRSVTGSDTNGFKIGFCCATYTDNLPGTLTGRNRHCNTYALWENIKYTVRLK